MGNHARQLLEAALALPKEERADLAEQLLASVEEPASDSDMYGQYDLHPDVEKAWAAEITRRAERALRGETIGIPGSEVDAEARRIIETK